LLRGGLAGASNPVGANCVRPRPTRVPASPTSPTSPTGNPLRRYAPAPPCAVEPRLSPIHVYANLVATAHGGDVAKGDRGGSPFQRRAGACSRRSLSPPRVLVGDGLDRPVALRQPVALQQPGALQQPHRIPTPGRTRSSVPTKERAGTGDGASGTPHPTERVLRGMDLRDYAQNDVGGRGTRAGTPYAPRTS
jgi:hypothetical protein